MLDDKNKLQQTGVLFRSFLINGISPSVSVGGFAMKYFCENHSGTRCGAKVATRRPFGSVDNVPQKKQGKQEKVDMIICVRGRPHWDGTGNAKQISSEVRRQGNWHNCGPLALCHGQVNYM